MRKEDFKEWLHSSGAASHMAIRCAEFGIPAAIGCGEKIYQRIHRMQIMCLDCENGRITEKQSQ